jgi:serine/threonine-protein kinase
MWTNASLNDRQAVEREVPELLSRTEHDLWRAPGVKSAVAGAYALLGDADRAIPFLEQALSSSYQRSITPALLRLDPLWDPIRNDPRFQKLCQEPAR